jgi:hypothetical protein
MIEFFEKNWLTCIAMRGWFLKWERVKPIQQVLLWWVHRTTNSRPLWLIKGGTYWENRTRRTVLSVLHPWSWWSTVEVCNKLPLDWSDIDLVVEFRNWKPKLLPFTWKCAVEWMEVEIAQEHSETRRRLIYISTKWWKNSKSNWGWYFAAMSITSDYIRNSMPQVQQRGPQPASVSVWYTKFPVFSCPPHWLPYHAALASSRALSTHVTST